MPEFETYYAGAYWGPRKESPEACAERAAAFFSLVAGCDPVFAQWYKPARNQEERLKQPLMPPDLSTLTELFRRGVNREPGGPAIEQLGFRCSFSTGGSNEDCAFLSVRCGMYSEAVSNSCVLSLPSNESDAARVLSAPVLASVVRAMALAWEPDWAVAMSHAHRDLIDKGGKADVWLGWVTYLSRQRGVVPPLPAPARVEPVEDKGTLIVLTPERFTAANPEHVAQAQRVRDLLAKAGLLRS